MIRAGRITADDVLTAVEDVKREVREDFKRGTYRWRLGEHNYPRSFSDLHDLVDANEYGGFTTTRASWPIEVMNVVQCTVDVWLSDGGIKYDDAPGVARARRGIDEEVRQDG